MSHDKKRITSIKDPRVVEARALASSTGRANRHKCQLQGEEIIMWALEANVSIEHVFYNAKVTEHPLLETLRERQILCYMVTEGILKKITETRYLVPFVGIADLRHPPHFAKPPNDFVLVLDGVQDHGNLGTIVRTAKGFGIHRLLSTQPDTDLFYKKTIDASRGKVFTTQLKNFPSATATLQYLKSHGYQIVATSPYASQVQSIAKLESRPLALVIGNETHGVSDELLAEADLCVQIPMYSQVESLNVGVATGISVYELKLKLVIAMLISYIRETLGREVNVTGKCIQAALDIRLREVSPLNSTQVILLMILKCDKTMTLEQIGKDTITFGDELQALLRPIIDNGFMIYDSPEAQGYFTITEKGEEYLGQIWPILEKTEAELLAGFSEQEKQRLNDFLKRIQANAKQIIKDEAIPEK